MPLPPPMPDAGPCVGSHYCCTVDANLCEDFDETSSIPAGWMEVREGGVGAVLISSAGFASGSSLQSTMNVGDGGVAALITTVPNDGASVFTLRFELQTAESCSMEPQTVAVLGFGAEENPAVILEGMGSFATLTPGFSTGGVLNDEGAAVMIQTATWTEVTLQVVFDKERTATLTADGNSSMTTETLLLTADSSATLQLGLGGSDGCTVYITDVTLDWN